MFVCVCVTAILCNDLLFKIIGQFVRKCTLALVRDSSDLWDKSSMAEIRQSKVNKMLILSTCHICSVTPITSAHVHVLGHTLVYNIRCQSMISLKQWRSAIGFFFSVVGCELNARTFKHDVTHFISFVPVWLFHFVCGSFTDAVHSILVQHYLMWIA